MRSDLQAAADALVERLVALDLGDDFDPRAAQAVVASGLHRLTVPSEAGGLGASMADAAEVLARVGGGRRLDRPRVRDAGARGRGAA